MCTSCGCGSDEVRIEGSPLQAEHRHEGSRPPADPDHHHHRHPDPKHTAKHEAHRHHSAAGEQRLIDVERELLARNDAFAAANRALLTERGILGVNLVSSPGAGKTALLVRTLEALRERLPVAVIEGDQQTANDAERIRATGVAAVQINTGKGCHLDAHMLAHGFERLPSPDGGLLFIENVGNLVCPASFDLGEAQRVVILSVTEGEDKPLKYPDIFASADLLLINKIDLLPHVDFDVDTTLAHARRVNPGIAALAVSARSGEGFDDWLSWLAAAHTLVSIGLGRKLPAPAPTLVNEE